MSLFFYLRLICRTGNSSQQTSVTAVFVNNQHGIQQQGQDFDKKFVFERAHSKEINRQILKVAIS